MIMITMEFKLKEIFSILRLRYYYEGDNDGKLEMMIKIYRLSI